MKLKSRQVLVAAGVAALGSGAPSTLHALLTGRDVRESTLAAGTILLRRESRVVRLAVAGVAVHLAISLGWTVVLAGTLPRRRALLAGTAAGLVIAAVDLGTVGRAVPRIRALPLLPQLADHIAFGLLAGGMLARQRSAASHPAPAPCCPSASVS